MGRILMNEKRKQWRERQHKMASLKDLMGVRFEKLIVIKKVEANKWGKTQWRCHCDCGKEVIVIGSHLKSGETKSCRKHPKGQRVADVIEFCVDYLSEYTPKYLIPIEDETCVLGT